MIADQAASIKQLALENKQLQNELSRSSAAAGNSASSSYEYRAIKLKDLADTYSRKVEIQTRQVFQIEKEAEVSKAKLLVSKAHLGTAADDEKDELQTRSHFAALQQRLRDLVAESNATLVQVAELRAKAEELHIKRGNFQSCRTSLSAEIFQKNKQISELLQSIRAANEGKQRSLQEAASLKAAAQQQASDVEEELKSINASLALAAGEANSASEVADAMQALRGLIGTSNAGEVVAYFSKLAAENREREQAVESCRQEEAQVQGQVQTLQGEIEKLEDQLLTAQQREFIKQVLQRRDQATEAGAKYEEHYHSTADRLDAVLEVVNNTLYKLGAKQQPQGSFTVNERVMERMGLLENYARATASVCKQVMREEDEPSH